MTIHELSKDNFDEAVANGMVIVDFWAPWCGPCRAFAPVFDKSAREHVAVTFAKVDIAAQRELAELYEVQSVPTLMVFRDGIPLFCHTGALQGSALAEVFDWVRGLDMNEVRRQLAGQG